MARKNCLLETLTFRDPWLGEPLRDGLAMARGPRSANDEKLFIEQEEEAEAAEEASLLHQHRLAIESGTFRKLDYLIASWSLKLAPSDHQVDRTRNRFELNFSFDQLNSSSSSSSSSDTQEASSRGRRIIKLIIPLSSVLFVYCVLVAARGSFLLSQLDNLVSNMKPSVREGALMFDPSTGAALVSAKAPYPTGTGRLCAHQDDIQYGTEFNMSEFIAISKELDSVGVPCRTQYGSYFFTNSLALMDPFLFYLLPILLIVWHARALRYDTLGFLYDPLGERRRLMGEFRELLAATSQHIQRHLTAGRLFKTMDCARITRHTELLQLLSDIKRRQLVRPIIISSTWYAVIAAMVRPVIFTYMLTIPSVPLTFAMIQFNADTRLRVQDRAAQAACLRWHPNGTLVKPLLYLGAAQREEELFLTREEQVAYEQLLHPQTAAVATAAPMSLRLLLYELRHIWTWRAILYTLQNITYLRSCAVLFAPLLTSIYTLTFIDKITWLVQIRAQVLCCYEQVSELLVRPPPCHRELASADRRLLFTRMTVAHLNYELFKRQYKYFRVHSNLFFTIVVSFSITIYTLLTIVILNTETKASSNFLIGIMGAFMLIVNTFMIACSLGPKLISSILQHAMRLLALLANFPELAGSPTLELWRRQLMGEQEVNSFAATHVLAYHISYKRVVAFNVHLVATMLLLWQSLSLRTRANL